MLPKNQIVFMNLNTEFCCSASVRLWKNSKIRITDPSGKNSAGGPRGRVVKVADFSALNHSIISPLWVRASLGTRVTCGTSQVLLAGVSGVFSPGTPVFAPPTD